MTKYHRLGSLNNRHLFLTVLEAGKFKVTMQADADSQREPLPGWQSASFSLCPHTACPQSVPSLCTRRVSSGFSSPSYQDTKPVVGVPPSQPQLNPLASQRPHLPVTSQWEFRVPHVNLAGAGRGGEEERHKHSTHNTYASRK